MNCPTECTVNIIFFRPPVQSNNEQKQIYEHNELDFRTFKKWNQMKHLGNLRSILTKEHQ